MNKAALIERLAAESAVSKKQAEAMLEALVDIIIKELKDFNMSVDVYDSWANADEVKDEYGIGHSTIEVDVDGCSDH